MATKAKKRKKGFLGHLKGLAILCLLGYVLVTFITQQVKLAESNNEISDLKTKISVATQTNDEYNRLLTMSDEKEYMEHIAIEKLGYAYPNETRYFDTSGN